MANGIDSAPISAAIFQRIYTAGNMTNVYRTPAQHWRP